MDQHRGASPPRCPLPRCTLKQRRLHLRDHIRLKQFYRLEPLDSCLYHCISLLPEEGVSRPRQNPSSASHLCPPTPAPPSPLCSRPPLFLPHAQLCSSP